MEFLITDILKNIDNLKAVDSVQLDTWIAQYPYISLLHQEKAVRNIRANHLNNADHETINRAAVYTTNLSRFSQLLIEADAPIKEAKPKKVKGSATPKLDQEIIVAPEETSSYTDEQISTGLAESAILSSEMESVTISDNIADEELADELMIERDLEEIDLPVVESIAQVEERSVRQIPETLSEVPQIDEPILTQDYTRWLLTLKPLAGSRLSESLIEEEKEEKSSSIISVALAEVLKNQGHYQEAINMYEKLGLKYPEKSDYFAAQIQKLRAL